MFKTILITVLIVAIGVILLAVKILFSKNGRFPQTHISGSRGMKERGIGCVQSQDREARTKKPWKVSERSHRDSEE